MSIIDTKGKTGRQSYWVGNVLVWYWYSNKKLHRYYGPARCWSDNWFIHGEPII